jgi:thiol-disulfide isomerase/thioredoxin
MPYLRSTFFLALILLLTAGLQAKKSSESSITDQLNKLRSLSTAERPAATVQLATDIRTLPPGLPKLKLADALSHLATEADPSQETLQAVAQTLSQALAESPLPEKKDQPPMPYMDLARYVRYANVTTDMNDLRLTQAEKILADNDADIAKADFTLKDLHGKKVTLSQLRGKIVLVNFWATWCPPCRVEMPILDAIYTHFQSQGLVVLSITSEDMFKVGSFLGPTHYHPPILIDDGSKVFKQFHIMGIPRSFVFDRDGKLVAQSIDQCSLNQFLAMLSKAGLQPQN